MSILKRILKVLKWVGIGLAGLAAILLLINGIAVWITNSQLESRLAAIRAAGDPVSLVDFQMEEVPAKENAVTYLNRARSDAEALTKELEPVDESMRERAADSENKDVEIFPNDDELKAIESAFAAYPKVIPLLQQAANCPGYFVDYSEIVAQSPHSLKSQCFMDVAMEEGLDHRMFERIISSHVSLLMSKKQYDQAARDCIMSLKLTRLAAKSPTMISFLCRVASRHVAFEGVKQVLRSGAISDEVRLELDDELVKVGIRHEYLRVLKTARALDIDYYDESGPYFPWYSKVFIRWEKIGTLDAFDWAIPRAVAALPENRSSTAINPRREKPTVRGKLGRMQVFILRGNEASVNKTEAEVRILRVLNALGRREDPDKKPLADLSDLGLPESATIDPFSGKPLIVKKVDGGWLVESVGEKHVDGSSDFEKVMRDICQ